ncbi:MAG: MBL fold metallo-hydrolase [Ferruginibacter sp.]
MALSITSLNSGSNGNCYYVGNDTEAVLVDVGLTCRETEKRMRILGLSMQKVKAIFISHEHGDHIKGLTVIAEKYSLPVYITNATCTSGRIQLRQELVNEFTANLPINIGALAVTAFSKFHDAADPHSFVISSNGITVGVFTDIGSPCDRLIKYFSQCHAAFLEANYDDNLLENGRYPVFLKNRIRGGHGHLSNKQALDVFVKHKPSFMSHLLLAHLSKDNNSPELAKQLFQNKSNGTEIIIASRYEQTPVYLIKNVDRLNANIRPAKIEVFIPRQLSLF